jgi:hypothetical protein
VCTTPEQNTHQNTDVYSLNNGHTVEFSVTKLQNMCPGTTDYVQIDCFGCPISYNLIYYSVQIPCTATTWEPMVLSHTAEVLTIDQYTPAVANMEPVCIDATITYGNEANFA